ncbi:MAG: DUF166 family protein [Chloroflexota bacterium]|nr:DUF166 family protein [Chloroflexota bacterium]
MRILAIISGEYGQRHTDNVKATGPAGWHIETWRAPAFLPPVIDDPDDFLPPALPASDLILSFAEHRGVAELLPDIAELTGASAVIAAVDNETWLPRGLARQLRGWLADMGVACVTPKPLCSLTEADYGVTRRQRERYDNPLIAEFAHHFGQPNLRIEVDPETRTIIGVEVKRDAVCGCARFTGEGLLGISADEAEQKGGMLHHHFPCMASMGIDDDFGDTLMHVSGNVLRDNIGEQVKPFKDTLYIRPAGQ